MPTLEQALFTYLVADPVVSALVLDRVYPGRLPERVTLPAIAHRRVDARRLYTFDSFVDTDAWVQARVQFDCWGRSALEAIEVGEAVLLALSGYDGEMGGELTVGSSFAVDEIDDYEAATRFYRRIVDMQLSYEEDLAPGESIDAVAQPGTVGGSGST